MSAVNYFLVFSTAWLAVAKYFSLRSASTAFGPTCPQAGVLWLHPFRILTIVVGQWFPFKHQLGHYYAKFGFYLQHGSTCIGSVTLLGSTPTLWLADAQAIKTVTSQPDTFQKDVEPYQLVNFYGQNLISIQGADWKRHRKVANPAFNEASNAFVWTETVRVINEWFAEMDAATNMDPSSSIAINVAENLIRLTLLVIASASFGRRASWQEDSSVPPPAGHLLSFRKAVTGAISHIFVQALTPKWIHALSERVHLPLLGPVLKETRVSFEALRLHMHELVSLSRAWVVGGKASNMDAGLLRNLVEANMAEDDDITHKKLTDNEVLSNIFAFLLAGFETSAHSLSFAIALLALYPDIQQKIYEETLRAWPDGCPTSVSPSSYKQCMPKLEYTLAAFHETLRLFPQVPLV